MNDQVTQPPAAPPEGKECPICAKQGTRVVLGDDAAVDRHRAEVHGERPSDNSPVRGQEPGPQPSSPPPPPPAPPATAAAAGDELASRVEQLENLGAHLSSEVGSIREALGRAQAIVDDVAGRAGALVEQAQKDIERIETAVGTVRARLEAQEQMTLGERLRRVEEKTGIVAPRPAEIDGEPGAPHRDPEGGTPADE